MILDREKCLGAHINNKIVTGIKFNGYMLYPYIPEGSKIYEPYEFRNKKEITEVNTMVTTVHDNLFEMFYCCESLVTIHNINLWNTSNVRSMSGMFCSCYSLPSINLSSFDTSNVIRMNSMFHGCNSLTELDLSNFNTSKVTDMDFMFSGCYKLTTVDLSSFDTSNVTDMSYMFNSCINLKTLDLSSFNTSKVTDMTGMFNSCWDLETLDISNFDLSNSTYANNILGSCRSLHTLRLDNCNNYTINKILYGFPTNAINGVTRKIYCKRENTAGLIAPANWEFVFIDEQVTYNEFQEKLTTPDYMIAELVGEQLIITNGFADYDADNENININ